MCSDRLLDRLIFATGPFKFIHKKSFPKSVFAEFRQVVDTRFKRPYSELLVVLKISGLKKANVKKVNVTLA